MQIGELAKLTGITARALRHNEERGILVPERASGGYREYADADVIRVAQPTAMIRAGLNTATIRRYLDCAHTEGHGTSLELCPDLTAELAATSARLEAEQAEHREKQKKLRELALDPSIDHRYAPRLDGKAWWGERTCRRLGTVRRAAERPRVSVPPSNKA